MIWPGKELLYLRSTGTQYIDTGFLPDGKIRAVCHAIVPNTNGTNWVFGARQSSSSKLFTFAFSTNGYFSVGIGASSQSFSKSYNTEKEITVDMGYTYNGDNITACHLTTEHGKATLDFGTYHDFTAPCPLTLFAGNTNGSITKGSVTIFSFDIYQPADFGRETQIMSLVPWMHDDGRIGMLDKLSGVFYPNAGTGEFEYEEKPEQEQEPMSVGKKLLLHQIFPPVIARALAGKANVDPVTPTETVTFDMKRFLEEPDGMAFHGAGFPMYGLWYASDKFPWMEEMLTELAIINVNGEKQYARFSPGEIRDECCLSHLMDENTGAYVASIFATHEALDEYRLNSEYGDYITVPKAGLYVLFTLDEADRAVYQYLDVCTCTLTWEVLRQPEQESLLLSSDGYILQDVNGLNLIPKEAE